MSVQFIFKTLIGTMAFIVISALLIEIFNLQIVSLRLASLSRLAASQSAELFAQESYKDEGGKRSSNLYTIKNCDGGVYIDGNIYGSGSATQIWSNLYNKENYKRFSADLGHNWYSLGIFDLALETNGNASASLPDWGNINSEDMDNYNKAMMANTYYENLYTPLNIGIPYLGEYHNSGDPAGNSNSVLDKAFKWNLTQLLSNCNEANIVSDDASGGYYVQYSGFRCYTSQAKIKKVTYEVIDVKTSEGNRRFKKLTGIDASGSSANSNGLAIGDTTNLTALTSGADERKNICVAFIEYEMPVSYKGITPIRSIFEWVWQREVQGMASSAPNLEDKTWNNSTQLLKGGGAGDNTLPTSGQLIYYVVR